MLALTAGVLLLALCVPVAWRALSNRSDDRVASSREAPTSQPRSRPSAPGSTATTTAAPQVTPSATTPIPRAAPGILIQVVPAVRDVQVMVGGALHTTNPDGIIDVPDARGSVQVVYVGYSVTPALQQVEFRSWSDGSQAVGRDLDADGRGHISLAVDLRYRVTIDITSGDGSAIASLTASSPVGPITFTEGSPRWVLAERGERSASGVVARRVTYSFDPPRGAAANERQTFTASPEAFWVVRAP